MTPEKETPLWQLRGIYKAFTGVQALSNVSLDIAAGEVHALLGENGSGKSTLVKCLAGAHQPDSGEMLHNGEPVTLHHPLEARQHGVASIYQEFSLVPTLSVAENIFLGRPPRRYVLRASPYSRGTAGGRLIDWEAMRRQTVQTLRQLDIHIDPDAIVRDLSVAEQQLVEIAKAISLESTLLIMDEPTAALGLAETGRLLGLVRRLAAQGKAILYISHRLDEVFQVADRATVLKDGRVVATRPTSQLTMSELVRLMVGMDIEQHYPKVSNTQPQVCLEVEDLTTENGVNGVTFSINVGEVFGLGGMVGSGRTEIARAIFGVDRITRGTIRLYGKPVRFKSPSHAIAAGVGLIPENRKADGLFFNFEAPPNITVSRPIDLLAGPFLSLSRERRYGMEYIRKLSITPSALEKSVRYLSGGNQQKVVIARWLFSQAKLLIMDEPTQGVDIGAKLDVYNVINELTAQGISILLISSDYPELLAMSDRVAVVRDGQILHIAEAGGLTEHELLAIASGAGLSDLVQRNHELRVAALPHLRDLRDRVNLTVHLAVLDPQEMRVLYLEKLAGAPGGHPSVGMISRAGMNANAEAAPAACTGVGKALLAFEPVEQVDAWVKEHGLRSYTRSTITDPEAFKAELAHIRASGVSYDREEHAEGIRCIAAPIIDRAGKAIAAISVSGPVGRMPPDLAGSPLRQRVVDTANAISEALASAEARVPSGS